MRASAPSPPTDSQAPSGSKSPLSTVLFVLIRNHARVAHCCVDTHDTGLATAQGSSRCIVQEPPAAPFQSFDRIRMFEAALTDSLVWPRTWHYGRRDRGELRGERCDVPDRTGEARVEWRLCRSHHSSLIRHHVTHASCVRAADRVKSLLPSVVVLSRKFKTINDAPPSAPLTLAIQR
jgi:hypothetical protein